MASSRPVSASARAAFLLHDRSTARARRMTSRRPSRSRTRRRGGRHRRCAPSSRRGRAPAAANDPRARSPTSVRRRAESRRGGRPATSPARSDRNPVLPRRGKPSGSVPQKGGPRRRSRLSPRPRRRRRSASPDSITAFCRHLPAQAGCTNAARKVPARWRASTRKGRADTRKRSPSASPNAG